MLVLENQHRGWLIHIRPTCRSFPIEQNASKCVRINSTHFQQNSGKQLNKLSFISVFKIHLHWGGVYLQIHSTWRHLSASYGRHVLFFLRLLPLSDAPADAKRLWPKKKKGGVNPETKMSPLVNVSSWLLFWNVHVAETPVSAFGPKGRSGLISDTSSVKGGRWHRKTADIGVLFAWYLYWKRH